MANTIISPNRYVQGRGELKNLPEHAKKLGKKLFVIISASGLKRVRDLLENPNPTAAIYCKTGECEIRVTAREATEQAAEAACNARIAEFKEILGTAAYDVDVPALEYTVVRALREHGLHAAAAESCTGGMLSLIHI